MRKINGLIFEENHCGIPHAEKMHFQREMAVMLQQREAPPLVRELVLLVRMNGMHVFFVCLFVYPAFKEIWLFHIPMMGYECWSILFSLRQCKNYVTIVYRDITAYDIQLFEV